jgi:hypothetical protein
MAVTHHQPTTPLINLVDEPGQIRLDLGLQRRGQHPPRPLPHDLIQPSHELLAGALLGDYPQHRRPSSPARQRRHPQTHQ